jgi:hypothetical protein
MRRGAAPRAPVAWWLLGALAFVALPWYLPQNLSWWQALPGVFGGSDTAAGAVQAWRHGKPWLWVVPLALVAAAMALRAPTGRAQGQAGEPGPEPDAPLRERLHEPVGAFGCAERLRDRLIPDRVLDRIPGQQQVGQQSDRDPEPDRGIGVPRCHLRAAHFGSELTSFSQRAIKRRRSALAPYFA